MTLRELAQSTLTQLGLFDQDVRAINVAAGTQELRCSLSQGDRLALSLDSFVFRDRALAGQTTTELEAIARRLANRLTYLLEPIVPLEIDDQRCVVQLRSSPPEKTESGPAYYELLVERGGEISLARFNKPRGQVRQRIPAYFTHQVFLRLIDDFSAAARGA